jgi:hypothetical protein
MLNVFENRVVLFDNKTNDAELRQSQINSLFDALDFVLSINDERPFSNEMLMNIQVLLTYISITFGLSVFSAVFTVLLVQEADQMFKSKRELYDEYLMHITKMVRCFQYIRSTKLFLKKLLNSISYLGAHVNLSVEECI